LSDKELIYLQQKKIKDQNLELENIVLDAKRGNAMARETSVELLKQNLLLEDMDKDVFDFNLDG
jgi:hypothetical protein